MVAVGPTVRRQGLDGLEPMPGDRATTVRRAAPPPRRGQLGQGGDGHPAGGLGEDALGAGQKPDPLDDLGVGDRRRPRRESLIGLERVAAVGRVADRERLGDVDGCTGRMASVPSAKAVATGEQPSAWAPDTRTCGSASSRPTRPTRRSPCASWSAGCRRRWARPRGREPASRAARRPRRPGSWSPRRSRCAR